MEKPCKNEKPKKICMKKILTLTKVGMRYLFFKHKYYILLIF